MSKWFYYIRVSSKDQKIDRQKNDEKLNEFCKRMNITEEEIMILCDRESGKDFKRANYALLKQVAREGDNIIVSSLDRFGRNYIEGRREFTELISKGIKVYVLDRPMLENLYKLNDSMSKFMVDFLVGWELINAEEELRRIKERQRQGIEQAKQKKVKFGRPPINIDGDLFKNIYCQWRNKEITAIKAMDMLGIKKSKFYSMINEYERRTRMIRYINKNGEIIKEIECDSADKARKFFAKIRKQFGLVSYVKMDGNIAKVQYELLLKNEKNEILQFDGCLSSGYIGTGSRATQFILKQVGYILSDNFINNNPSFELTTSDKEYLGLDNEINNSIAIKTFGKKFNELEETEQDFIIELDVSDDNKADFFKWQYDLYKRKKES